MKTLLLMRHAKSSWSESGLADHDRPLNKRGKQAAPEMGRLLRKEGLVPDLILCSTARRSRQTAEAVAQACGYEGTVESQRDLYYSDAACYTDILRHLPDRVNCVLLVGHNPESEELLEMLTGSAERMTTAAIAHIDLPIAHWQLLTEALDVPLLHLWRPRELEG
jgi:phosphohistidine phosphatase